jgi:two-component system, OmpR family, response regulator
MAEIQVAGAPPRAATEAVAYGPIRLDPHTRRLGSGTRSTRLTRREFALLQHLMRHAGSVCTRSELLSEVWGYDFDPGSNVVDVTIARLRGKIHGLRIETVRNVGYTLKRA